jgi:hypothetical protein
MSNSSAAARYWRDRAGEALMQAAEISDEWARWTLIQIAVGYDHLARRAEDDPDRLTSADETE